MFIKNWCLSYTLLSYNNQKCVTDVLQNSNYSEKNLFIPIRFLNKGFLKKGGSDLIGPLT